METFEEGREIERLAERLYGRSLFVYHMDAGSSGACNREVAALTGPAYGLARYGVVFVDHPAGADVLLVTGVVCRALASTLWEAFGAAGRPLAVVAVGDCATTGGIFSRAYGTTGAVDADVPVDVYIPGCPPHPKEVLHGLHLALCKLASRAAQL